MKKSLLFFSAFLLCLTFSVHAQIGIASGSATSIGLAGSNGASLYGWEAILMNPAGLASQTSNKIDFTVFSIGGLVGNDHFSRNFYDTYFTGNLKGEPYDLEKDPEGKQEVISAFEPQLNGYGKSQFIPFSISIQTKSFGNFGFMILTNGSGRFSFPNDFSKRIFSEVTSPGTTTKLDGLIINAMFRNEYIFSYANTLPVFRNYLNDFQIGGSLKLESGLSYARFEIAKDVVSTSEDGVINHELDYEAKVAGNDYFRTRVDSKSGIENPGFFMSPAGFGLGFDVGISGTTKAGMKFYFSVMDLGWINWTENAVSISVKDNVILRHYQSGSDSESDSEYIDSLKQHYQPKREENSFSTPLPATVNAGISFPFEKLPFFEHFHYPGKLTGYLAIHQGLNNESGNTFIPRAATGIDWMFFNSLSVRSGISFGGIETFNWAAGLGFKTSIFQIDLATANLYQILLGYSATKYSFSVNARWYLF